MSNEKLKKELKELENKKKIQDKEIKLKQKINNFKQKNKKMDFLERLWFDFWNNL